MRTPDCRSRSHAVLALRDKDRDLEDLSGEMRAAHADALAKGHTACAEQGGRYATITEPKPETDGAKVRATVQKAIRASRGAVIPEDELREAIDDATAQNEAADEQ